MRVRPTEIIKYETCPAQLYWSKRLRPPTMSANFGFGKAFHEGTEAIVRRSVGENVDPVSAFDAKWDQESRTPGVEFKQGHTPASLKTMGHSMLTAFSQLWDESGNAPWVMPNGELAVENRLAADIGGGLILTTQPDQITLTREGLIGAEDSKSAAQRTDPIFAEASDQLTAQQIVADANAERLGFDRVEVLSFLEVTKQKTPKAQRLTAERRSATRVREYVDKVQRIAEDIDKGIFPRRTLGAYNSPCKMCEFAQACLKGDLTGYTEIKQAKRQAA